ncbi:MAG: transglutaminase-like domain-containing protein [Phycisphaerae bacterium]
MRVDRVLYVGLIALAVLGVELTLVQPEQARWVAPLKAAAWIGVALVVSCHGAHRLATSSRWQALIIWSLAVLPFVWNGVSGIFGARPLPLELAILAALRNVIIGLMAVPGGADSSRLAVLVSLVQVIAVAMLTDSTAASVVVATYAALGGMWLVLAHWNSLHWSSGYAKAERPPLAALCCLIVLIGGAATLGAFGPQRVACTLGEWLPSSGGSLGEHPNARAGVGNGLDSAGDGENADSTGFDGGETFRESDLSSLYDVMTEIYGTPKPPDQIERAIALSPDKVKFKEGLKNTHSHKAGRSFSMLRRSPPCRSSLQSIEADALLYVKGRTPLHLRTAVYDRFDGVCWHEAPAVPARSAIRHESGTNWMCVQAGLMGEQHAETAEHEIKVGLFESNCIPTPLHLDRFRVGLVDATDFFSRRVDGLLSMVRRVPSATTIETHSSIVRPDYLTSARFASLSMSRDERREAIFVPPEVARLASEWGGAYPRGWGQISTLIDRLQRHCRLDPAAATEEISRDPSTAFVSELRRGPAYHFASASAIMLHSLGYRVRLVSGFYVSPERFDRRTQHTPVQKDDVHFWLEVQLADGTWLTLEPTPGHDTLKPTPSMWARLLGEARSLFIGVLQAWRGILTASCIVVVVVASRRRLADLIVTLVWRFRGTRSWQEMSLRTLWLLDHRCRLAGRTRPAAMTPARWYGALTAAQDGQAEDVRELVNAANQAAFAPATGTSAPKDLEQVCRRVVEHWTVRRFRQQASERSGVR